MSGRVAVFQQSISVSVSASGDLFLKTTSIRIIESYGGVLIFDCFWFHELSLLDENAYWKASNGSIERLTIMEEHTKDYEEAD